MRNFDSKEKGEVIMEASSKIIDSKQPRAGAKPRIIQKETQRVVHQGLSDTGKTLVVLAAKQCDLTPGNDIMGNEKVMCTSFKGVLKCSICRDKQKKPGWI